MKVNDKKLTPQLRFPEFKNSGEWEEDKLSSIINLISSNVKVQKKEYLSIGKYPIIDQSINYIAGYTNNSNAVIQINSPVIVFGDHTCILKYIDFNFAQGADGIKILSISKLYPRFVYYAILNANIQPDGYKRHFSILKNIPIKYPVSSKEQQKIADFLSSVDELIIEQIKKIKLLQEYKKGLLQQVLSVR